MFTITVIPLYHYGAEAKTMMAAVRKADAIIKRISRDIEVQINVGTFDDGVPIMTIEKKGGRIRAFWCGSTKEEPIKITDQPPPSVVVTSEAISALDEISQLFGF